MVKKILNSCLWFFIILVTGTLVVTLLNYFNIINSKIISIVKFILPIISMFISSYKLGKVSNKNGYLEGLKLGSIIILIFMLLVIILDSLELKSIFYYLILLLTSAMSSMIGINKKKAN